MGFASTLIVLLFSLVLCMEALEQHPLGRRSKRDTMTSMFSFFSSVDKRLAALEANRDNSTEERLARLETKMEEEMQEKQQHMEEKLQNVQDVMQRLESMVQELLSSRLESMVTEILTSKMKSSEEKVAELVEAKTNATEERLASLEASNTEAQSSPASCRYQYLYRYEKEAPRSSADQHRMTKLESELTRLQEKVSTLDKRLQDNDVSVGSLHNASVLAMEGVVHSVTELVATSEQNLHSIMQNATEILASMMSSSEAHMLANIENNTAALTRIEQTTKDLWTRMSAVEHKLNNASSIHAEEMENTKAMLEDMKKTTEELSAPLRYRRTCQAYYDDGQKTSGVYKLQLHYPGSLMEVYCEMNNGVGWVVFQRRQDGSVDFYRNWTSFEEGFGDLNGEFWLGNRNIHRLTSAGLTQLRVDLQAWNNSTAFAFYSHFSVGDASSSYTLSVSGYSGTAGDSLEHSNRCKFSTYDQDHDDNGRNCAQVYKGAWWHGSCTNSHLNGVYGIRGSSGMQYVFWNHWLGVQSLQRTELKLK